MILLTLRRGEKILVNASGIRVIEGMEDSLTKATLHLFSDTKTQYYIRETPEDVQKILDAVNRGRKDEDEKKKVLTYRDPFF